MIDLTVIYLTLNRMPESWVNFHMEHLKKAIGVFPVITISRLPVALGTNILDDEEFGYVNIYRQMLRAAKLVDTKYVAVAEDDVLYSSNHFIRFRPKDDEFAYNRNRWSVFSWGEPVYSWRQRISNCSMVAPKKLLIEALSERFDKYNGNPPRGIMGECGRNKVEEKLGITLRKQVDFFSNISLVQLNHPGGTEDRQKQQHKAHAEIRAYDIPYWGRPESIIKYYNSGELFK